MTKATTTLLLCLNYLFVVAQDVTYFSSLFDYQGLWQDAIAVRQLPSGNILTLARTLGGSISDNKIFMIWANEDGDTLKTRVFQIENMGHWMTKGGLHIYPDESFVIGGTLSDVADVVKDFFIAKFDSMGDTLWFRLHEAPLTDICRSIIPTPEGGFALAGKSRSFGDPNFGNFHLMKTDSLGNVEWRQSYGQNNVSEDASSLSLTPEGDYMLAGIKGPDGSTEMRVMRVNSNGDLIWQKTFGGAANSDSYPTIVSLLDGNFLLLGTIGLNLDRDAYLAKIDGDGNLIWERTYPSEYNTFFQNAVEMDNGDLVVLGQTYFYNETISYYYQKSNISRLTSNGDEIWKRYHFTREDRHNYLYDVVRTSDGGFLAGGFALSDTSERSDAWVVKMDSLGCAVPGCELVNSTEDKVETLVGATVKMAVLPNPFREMAEIGFFLERPMTDLLIEAFDPTGKLIKKTPLTGSPGWNSVPFEGGQLPNGTYFFVLKADGEVVSTCRAVRID